MHKRKHISLCQVLELLDDNFARVRIKTCTSNEYVSVVGICVICVYVNVCEYVDMHILKYM